MDELVVEAGFKVESRVLVGRGSVGRLPGLVAGMDPSSVVVVVDSGLPRVVVEGLVSGLRGEGMDVSVLDGGGGENAKSLAVLEGLWAGMARAGVTRDSVVVAVGGGALLDVAGFAAATYMRGVRSVYVPTTTLAQADAGIGGKTGVDLAGLKNVVGAFHMPVYTIVDPGLLAGLPWEVYISGYAEIVKHAALRGRRWVEYVGERVSGVVSRDPGVVEELVRFSIETKVDFIRRDYREKGVRALLNFGHTLGHAVESVSGYRVGHGQAVAVGMVGEALLASRVLGFPREELDLLVEVLSGLGLPTRTEIFVEGLLDAMRHDKKFLRGKPRLPLPRRFGVFKVVELGWGDVEDWLRRLVSRGWSAAS